MNEGALKLVFLTAALTVSWVFFHFDSGEAFGISYFMPLVSVLVCIVSIVSISRQVKIIYLPVAGVLYFNFQWYLLSLFDRSVVYDLSNMYNFEPSYFLKAAHLFSMSLAAISIGYIVSVSRVRDTQNGTQHYSARKVSLLPFQMLAFAFLFLSIIDTGLSVGSTYIGAPSHFYLYLFRLVILVLVIRFYIIHVQRRPVSKVANGACFALALLFIAYAFIGGDRGPILTILLILGFGWLLARKMTLSLPVALLIGFAGTLSFMAFKSVEVFRQMDVDSLSLALVAESISVYMALDYWPDDLTRATAITIQNIDNGVFTYSLGSNFLMAVLSSIPGFGRFILAELSNSSGVFSSAEVLSIHQGGVHYSSGFGTTYLADSYLEFGLVGVLGASLMYGYFVGWLQKKVEGQRQLPLLFYIMLFIFVGFSFYMGRSPIWAFLVYFIHAYIIYIFVNLLGFGFFHFLRKGR